MRLLPKGDDNGWAPYIWLAYFGFFFIHPIADHVGWKEWLATGVASVLFLFLYFANFWVSGWRRALPILGLVLMGIVYAPYNPGACDFFIYAAAFIPFAVEGELIAALLFLPLLGTIALESWLLHLNWVFWVDAALLSVLIGGGNIYFAQKERTDKKLKLAQDEIEHLAKVAERERIARDLHDVLGHTLSVIILKSELAAKLIERDPARAKKEIEDVERTSREALAEVRSTVRGYRSQGLDEELKRAKAALQIAGVAVTAETANIQLTPSQETVVALVVREAVTNVVRHAEAKNCVLRLTPSNGSCLLEIHDDGRGSPGIEGNGLRGMRERIEALGGTLLRQTERGTKLIIQFPLAAANQMGAQ